MNKKTVKDLAMHGGMPAFDEVLHVGRPNIGNRARLMARIDDVLNRGWLTNNGPLVQEFEQRTAEHLGVRHCVAMCNGTVALEIAIRALDMKGEVIVPSFTFVATAHALQWQEITPVFCDVRHGTHLIDPEQVERLITPRTTGIIGVHVWGRPCMVDALEEIAGRRKLQLMFDASHAFGCSYRQRMIGSFGRAEVFSFHATKFFNTFEGGAVTTNDDSLAHKMRLMKNFGFAGYDNVVYVGTNGKMNELSAAMGLTGLEDLDGFIDVNRRNHRFYAERLSGLPGIRLLACDTSEKQNWQYVVLEVEEREAGIGRDELLKVLHAENVLARRYFHPGCHRMEPYRSYFPHAGLLLPETEALCGRVLVLPTGMAVGEDEIEVIASIVRVAACGSAEPVQVERARSVLSAS